MSLVNDSLLSSPRFSLASLFRFMKAYFNAYWLGCFLTRRALVVISIILHQARYIICLDNAKFSVKYRKCYDIILENYNYLMWRSEIERLSFVSIFVILCLLALKWVIQYIHFDPHINCICCPSCTFSSVQFF